MHILLGLLLLFAPLAAAQAEPKILMFGDSLSAAYGIDTRQGWVTLLQQRLEQKGYPHRVVNASISGETSSSGRTRISTLLAQHKPDVVILELGANDGLRGLPIKHLRNNLARMIELAQKQNTRVVLVGMRIPPNYGKRYTDAFYNVYVQLAEQYRLILIPFLLDSVGGRDGLMQDDGLHPNEKAQPVIADTVWKYLRPLL